MDMKYWDDKFRERKKLGEPEEFIVKNICFLTGKSVLDIACGVGRNAIYLAKRGFSVTGADYSEEALKKLNSFAEMNEVYVNTIHMDLDDEEKFIDLKTYDNIIINHYKPCDAMIKFLPSMLNQSGTIIICTFNMRQAVEYGFEKELCIESNEYVDRFKGLHMIKHEQFKDNRGYLEGYIFEK